MAAETNTIMKNDVARVRMVDFNYQFTGNLNKFMEILGVTRKIAVQEGAVLKALKVTGTLESGAVAEGEQREIARMGGIASGKARREKQKTQQILADLVSIKNKDLATFQEEAEKMGLDGDISIHELFTMVCLLNSVKSGNLGDLDRLSKLLGEDKQNENADVLSKLDKVIGEVDKLAE